MRNGCAVCGASDVLKVEHEGRRGGEGVGATATIVVYGAVVTGSCGITAITSRGATYTSTTSSGAVTAWLSFASATCHARTLVQHGAKVRSSHSVIILAHRPHIWVMFVLVVGSCYFVRKLALKICWALPQRSRLSACVGWTDCTHASLALPSAGYHVGKA